MLPCLKLRLHRMNSALSCVLSPIQLDAQSCEIEALTKEAAVHDLGWLKRMAVHGEDRFRWLSGMVTNTVNELEPTAERGIWC